MLPSQFEYITDASVIAMMIGALETGATGWVDDLALRIESDDASESYGWLGTVPGLHEFIGSRKIEELKEYSFSIANTDHESVIRVQIKDLRRDKMGMIQARVDQFGQRVLDYPAQLLSTLILNAESTACYDGSYFFDTAHASHKSGSQSNDITATAVAPTLPTADEMTAAIMKAVQTMLGLKDDQGHPTNQGAKRFKVMVPVPYMTSALQAVTAILGTGGASALLPALKGKIDIEIEVNPRLTWTTKMAVFRADGVVKPFILQQEGLPEPFALGPTSEHAKKERNCLYGVDWSGNVGYGDWKGAVLVTFQ